MNYGNILKIILFYRIVLLYNIMSNIINIIYNINNSDYSIDEYNHIIDACNIKITNIQIDDYQIIFINNLKNIIIKNEELNSFLNLILSSISFNIEDYNDLSSVIINFEYKEYQFNLCLYYDDCDIQQKLCINNTNTHAYEIHYKNHEEILLKTIDLKTISSYELYSFIKELFDCLPPNIINKWCIMNN
jgi:hypothetical protein